MTDNQQTPAPAPKLVGIEQCAKIADRFAANNKGSSNPQAFAAYTVASEIAKAIRALSSEETARGSELYQADAFMADGEIPMTAAENVLAWLLIEKIGVPDDVGYSPNQAKEIIERRLEQVRELEQIDDMLDEGQGDDEGSPIMPELTKGMTTYAKVEACLHLLERRRDALHPSPHPRAMGTDTTPQEER